MSDVSLNLKWHSFPVQRSMYVWNVWGTYFNLVYIESIFFALFKSKFNIYICENQEFFVKNRKGFTYIMTIYHFRLHYKYYLDYAHVSSTIK